MLNIDIKPGESVRIGDVAVITLVDKSGKAARLSIVAKKDVPISRDNLISQSTISDLGITMKPK